MHQQEIINLKGEITDNPLNKDNLLSNDKMNTKHVFNGVDWNLRNQDVIITLPGIKHTFEAVGGDLVDLVSNGVVNWLSKI
jgi:hypothetical protein